MQDPHRHAPVVAAVRELRIGDKASFAWMCCSQGPVRFPPQHALVIARRCATPARPGRPRPEGRAPARWQ
jgi:hypothetical protein